MKVQYQLQGTFHRIQLSGIESNSVSLRDFIREVQAVATEHHRQTPQLLRQSFGLNFLPEPVLINLLQQAQGAARECELYQVPSLQRLQPVVSNSSSQAANTYSYQFRYSQTTLYLTPDNPQIPLWTGNNTEQSGNYTLTLEQPYYPGVPDDFTKNVWQQAIKHWQQLPETQKIHIALQSLDPAHFRLLVSQTPHLSIWISLQDLSLDLRSAITFLSLGEGNVSTLSESVRLLVQQYQATYSLPIRKLPKQFKYEPDLLPAKRFVIGKRNSRSAIEKIISHARQFLLISSYIIEDETLTQLICQKAQELPPGVWVLTALRNEVLNKIDAQVSNNINIREEYQRSNQRKKACLQMLLNANIPIRSGTFHLKTYISEQYAYLGSCNLTGGSLDFNIEAGIVSRNTSIHSQLITLFQQFWQQHSRDEVIPTSNYDGFSLRSLHRFCRTSYESYPTLLTPSQYQRDLIEHLRNFKGQVQIYSRSFQPSLEIEQYLNLLDTRVFVDSTISANHSKISINKIAHLHAKITLLGEEVAYIGGINFNFSNSSLSLDDLMYKTTNSIEIHQIHQNIYSLL